MAACITLASATSGCGLLFGGNAVISPAVEPPRAQAPVVGPEAAAAPVRTVDTAAVGALPLVGGGWLLNSAEGPVLLTDGQDPRPLGLAPGTVHAAAWVEQGVLMAGTGGMTVATADEVVVSPLGAWLNAQEVVGLYADGARVWVVRQSGASVLADGVLADLDLPGFVAPVDDHGFGPAVDGTAALWLRAGNVVWAVGSTQGQVQAWRVRDDLELRGMALEGAVSVVLLESRGDVHVRGVDQSWEWFSAPVSIESVGGSGVGSEALLRTVTGPMYFAEGAFRPLTGVVESQLLAHGSLGRILVADANGVTELAARRSVTLVGLPEDGTLTGPVALTLQPQNPQDVRRAFFKLDNEPEVELTLPDPQVLLNPNQLGLGQHRFLVRVRYAGGVLSAQAAGMVTVLSLHTPTWAQDVAALFQSRCDRCHGVGPGRNAHTMNTAQAWQDEIDSILEAVRAGRMPLNAPSLSQAEILLLEEWKAAGFPE